MTCEKARELLADAVAGMLDASAQFEYKSHLNGCAMCSDESAEAIRMWELLGRVPEEEPSSELSANFYRMLDAYQQGERTKSPRWWTGWFMQPAWQAAFAAALLTVGLTIGYYAGRPSAAGTDVANLRSELNQMRQLVTLSMLQQQSASDRLQGVNFSYRVAQSDTEVLSALLRTVNTDTNVNVRLAAADALRSFASSPIARRGIMQSLLKQTSPLVQVAILDLLAELRDRTAVDQINTLLQSPDLDENVRKRAHWALDQLK